MLGRVFRWKGSRLTGEDAAAGSAVNAAAVGDDLDVRVARELIDKAREDGVSLVGPNGLLRQLTKTVLETALNAELDDHLGYEKGDPSGKVRVERAERVVGENGAYRCGRSTH
ncbi:transposase [Saccharopolyspora soli]|uniref:transposase n=1 Tax=Saccharopolyspora soli TaxID=2926618 RepID=UPI0035590DA6